MLRIAAVLLVLLAACSGGGGGGARPDTFDSLVQLQGSWEGSAAPSFDTLTFAISTVIGTEVSGVMFGAGSTMQFGVDVVFTATEIDSEHARMRLHDDAFIGLPLEGMWLVWPRNEPQMLVVDGQFDGSMRRAD